MSYGNAANVNSQTQQLKDKQRGFGFNNPEQEFIYEVLIDAGVNPKLAKSIATNPNSVNLTTDGLYVLANVVTDDSGTYIINTNVKGENVGQYGTVAGMIDYFTTDAGKVEATRLYDEQDSYLTAVENKDTYNKRARDFNTRYTDAVKQYNAVTANPDLYDESTKQQTQATMASLEKEYQSLNDEYQSFIDWGLEGTDTSQKARPTLSRMSSVYDERGTKSSDGNYYLSKDDEAWAQQAAQEAAIAKEADGNAATTKNLNNMYNTYRATGGQLAQQQWSMAGSPTSGSYEATTPFEIANKQASGLNQNMGDWLRNNYSSIYGEFDAQDSLNKPATEADAIKSQATKNARWEEYLKKYNLLQKYKGIAPVNRGEYSGRLAPKARVLNY